MLPVFLWRSSEVNPFFGRDCFIFKWLWLCTCLYYRTNLIRQEPLDLESKTGRKVREWFDLGSGKEDISGRNGEEKKIPPIWNCFFHGSQFMFSLCIFFSQHLDKWASPHSLPEDMIVANPVEVTCLSQMSEAAEQAQKKARMEESWEHESLISFNPHFNYFLPLNSKIATTQ